MFDKSAHDAYRYYLRMERQMADNTVASYCSDIADFMEISTTMAKDAQPADIEEYFAIRSEYLSKRSQARILSSLKSFFDWMLIEGERQDNPCELIDAPKLGRYLPEVLSVEEIDSIISSVQLDTWLGLRDRAILEVLYGCGLRVSELCSLKISHIYMEDGFIRIVGKGNKERLVPLGDMASQALSLYFESRPSPRLSVDDDIAFLNKNYRKLGRVGVFNMVKRQAESAGVNKEISPHTFRHSFATHLIENGADLRIVQEMLGHESILTTEIYTHIDQSTWQNSILSHHPRK